ncbi:MAG: ATP-binding protein [Syntrophus sp. (in: bacteria)]
MSQFHKAERKKGKLRLAIAGPAGSGKTYSALLIAFGLGGRVAMIDTERGSGELYDHLGLYDACTVNPPFEPRKYVEAIRAAEDLGYETIIVDSLSHAWVGQGGLLDFHGHIADKTGNSWSAWRQVTPKHNELVDAMLQSKCHVIATMRSKMEYTQVEENGKKQVKKLGMSPIQRDGMEYEFTVFMDLDHHHTATTTKDRTTLFDGQYFVPTIETGKTLLAWLENAGKEEPQVESLPHPSPAAQAGNGDGMKHLFARLTILDIRTDAYKLYCYRRYGIASMTELSPDQINEQTKLLDSLKRPARLREFKALLEKIAVEDQEAAKVENGEPADVPEPDLNGTISQTRPIAVIAGKANAPAFM